MKISYISGINAPTGRDGMASPYLVPIALAYMNRKKGMDGFDESLIGACDCQNKGIGDDTIPPYHKGEWKGSFDDGLDWYRVRRQQDKGAPELSTGAKAEWYLKKQGASLFRGAFLQFIKANGGGIATSLYNNVFRIYPKSTPPPTAEIVKVNADISAYAEKIGVKIPNDAQKQKIKDLSGLVCSVVGYEGTGLTRKPITKCTAKMPPEDAHNRIMGAGQFKLYADYINYKTKKEEELKLRYTIPVASEKGKKEYYDGLQVRWFWFGGNPEDLTEAIIEGNQKSPRGRDANYMLMVAKTRGLKAKDVGLIIRGFTSAFAGQKFDWGGRDTYIFGTKNGIGLTGAEVAAWVGANLPLITAILGLVGSIFKAFQGFQESGEIKREIDKLLSEGWVTEEDYLGFTMPRPKVLEVKQFNIPTTELDGMAILNLGIQLTKGGAQAKAVEEEAKADPNTSEFLSKIVQYGQPVAPKEGNQVVTLIKIDPKNLGGNGDNDGKSLAGGLILPMLIGVGVVMALNTAKKQK